MVRTLRLLVPCLLILSTACKANLAAAEPGTEAPAGYTVIKSIGAGRALSVRKREVKSVRAGLQATLKDLATVFDAPPVVEGAYEDKRNHRAGGAIFAAPLHGQASEAAEGNAAQGDGLRRYDFPDGSGFVGLASGWQINAQSRTNDVLIKPWANSRQMGQGPPPFFQLVAPYTGPLDAVRNLAVQNELRENMDASNQRFAAQQQAHREQTDAFDRRNRGWEQNLQTQARSNDDFSEATRGSRTIQDTRTGEKASVNSGNIDAPVDALNAQDPDRYELIPLRDEDDSHFKWAFGHVVASSVSLGHGDPFSVGVLGVPHPARETRARSLRFSTTQRNACQYAKHDQVL